MPLLGKPPQGAFFDTDFSSIGDLLAVSLLYGLQNRGTCRVAVITVSRPNLAVAGFADAVVRFYHGPAANFAQLPPIGMRTAGPAGETSPAFTLPFQKTKPDGTAVYRNLVKSVVDTADPITLVRNYLEAQSDGDAFFVLSGPASNLAAALAFPGMKEKIAAKVKLLAVACGAFPNGPADPCFACDIPAAQKLFAEWPSPIVVSGAEIGDAIPFPGAAIDKEFAAIADHPVADAYRAWQPMPFDAPSAALAAALYAARPAEGCFQLSAPGKIRVDDRGRASFGESAAGNHRYLIFDPAQKVKVAQAYVELAASRPQIHRPLRPPVAPDAPAAAPADK